MFVMEAEHFADWSAFSFFFFFSLTSPSLSISEIVPGLLFIGGHNSPTNTGFFTDRGIGYALNVSDDMPRAPCNNYLQIRVADSMTEDLARYWDETSSFIARAKKDGVGILVYDFSGVSRAPAFVMAYLMKHEKLLLRECLELLKEKRRWVNPNIHFMTLLSDLEFDLFGVRSVVVVFDDRERAHLEFPEGVELPVVEDDAERARKEEKRRKKEKKKEKKKKKKGTLVLKQPKKDVVEPAPQETQKRLKRDKFAWDNSDVFENSKISWESGRVHKK